MIIESDFETVSAAGSRPAAFFCIIMGAARKRLSLPDRNFSSCKTGSPRWQVSFLMMDDGRASGDPAVPGHSKNLLGSIISCRLQSRLSGRNLIADKRRKGKFSMQKKAFLVSFILLIIIGCLLLWQWILFSNKEAGNGIHNSESVSQKIDISVKSGQLTVKQKIAGLSKGKEYEIRIPPVAEQFSGLPAASKMTVNPDGSKSGTFRAESETLAVNYEIPFVKNRPSLWGDWLCEIKNATVTGTTIEVIDLQKGKGTWVAGIPLTTVQELEHFDHYFYRGRAEKPALYWHPVLLKKVTVAEDKLTVYYEGDRQPEAGRFSKLESLTDFPYVSLILTDHLAETEAAGIMIFRESGGKSDEWLWKLTHRYFLAKLKERSGDREWAADVLTSLFTGIKGEGKFAEEAIQELENNFSEKELHKFINKAAAEKEHLSAEKLDRYLSEIKGKKTDFFALNRGTSSQVTPLYFYEARDIYVNEKLQKEIKVVYKDGERFYSVKETFAALSYDVEIVGDGKTLLLSKDTRNYRFYAGENIFILNEEHYGLLEQPLLMIGERMFIKEKWLKKIFDCLINEEESKLEIFSL